jgi:hypothetical protein
MLRRPFLKGQELSVIDLPALLPPSQHYSKVSANAEA